MSEVYARLEVDTVETVEEDGNVVKERITLNPLPFFDASFYEKRPDGSDPLIPDTWHCRFVNPVVIDIEDPNILSRFTKGERIILTLTEG